MDYYNRIKTSPNSPLSKLLSKIAFYTLTIHLIFKHILMKKGILQQFNFTIFNQSFTKLKIKLGSIVKRFNEHFSSKNKNFTTKFSLALVLIFLGFAPTYAQDADNDGVLDHIDLDDDNDGILDITECPSIFASGIPNSAYFTLGVLDFNIMGGLDSTLILSSTGQNFDLGLQDANLSGCTFNLKIVKASGDGVMAVGFPTTAAGGTLQLRIDEVSNTDTDNTLFDVYYTIDGSCVEAFSLRYTWAASWNFGEINSVSVGGSSCNLVPHTNNTYGGGALTLITDTSPNGEISYENQGASQSLVANHFYISPLESSNCNTMHAQLGVNKDFGTTTGINNMPLIFYYNNDFCDADGDNIYNFLDTDSDNDGCPDALEGDGGFTANDIENGVLTGTVDTDGIPVSAASGQASVSSIDSTIVSIECDSCTTYIYTGSCTVSNGNIGIAGTPLNGTSAPFTKTPNCLLIDDNEADLNRGFMIGCAQTGCPVNTTAPPCFEPLVIPTFSCPAEMIEYTKPIKSDSVYMQYWSDCVPTVDSLPDITAAHQGFINQLFCDLDINGYPMAPSSIGAPYEGIISELPVNGGRTDELTAEIDAASTCAHATSDMELIQSDFWILVPASLTDIGFSLSGGAADASLFMVGTAVTNMCATAELLDGASQGIEGSPESYYTIPTTATTACGGKFLRARLYITDIAIGFNTTPEINTGDGFDTIENIDEVSIYPATGPNDNIPPTLPLETLSGFLDKDGNIFASDTTTYEPFGCVSTIGLVADICITNAENDINQTPQDVPVDGNILTNDTDPTGDTQTVQSATGIDINGDPISIPLDGTTATTIYGTDTTGALVIAGIIIMDDDGTYTFDPAPTFTGDVPVDYVVEDTNGNTDTSALTIEVLSTDDPTQNDPPVANDDTNTTEIDTNVSASIIDPNDSDPDGDTLLVVAVLADTNGDEIVDDMVTLNTPTPIYGTDDAGNTVLAGTITIHDSGIYTFDPEPTFTGDVPVDYTISDGNGGTDDATLIITIIPDDGNNTFANDDSNTGDMGKNQSGNILFNDNDPETDDQDIESILVDTDGDGIPEVVTPVAGTPTPVYQNGVLIGEITISPMVGSYDWNPVDDFVGTAVIPYTTTDNNGANDTATLYLTTLPVNTIASEDDFNNTPFNTLVSGDVSTNDVDEEGHNQTFTLEAANGGMDPADGMVTLNPDGSYTFTPANGFSGETEFQYAVCDDGTPALCDTSTVFLEVFPLVNPETPQVFANPDANTVKSGQTGTGNVMSNDLDPDALNPAVTTTLTSQTVPGVDEDGNPVADAGTLTLNVDGSYSFTPTGNFTGTVTQPYTICNAEAPAVCDDTELIIDVIPDNGNTTFANDDAELTDAGVTVSNNISDNDIDSEMDAQAITDFLIDTDGDGAGDTPGTIGTPTTLGGTNDMGVFVVNAGEITLNSDGSYSFTPAPGFVGNVNVPYTTCDDDTMDMACEDATLVITILDVKRDYGDGPVTYPVVWHRAVTDSNDDNILDGGTDVWLGTNTNFETAQPSSPTSDGDQFDDAISFGAGAGEFPLLAEAGNIYDVNITVNSAQADLVYFGMWIDWDEDGIYDDFHTGSQATASPATATVTITAPAIVGNSVNVRLRADDDPFISTDFAGGKTNGEVEDFQALVVLPVTLTHFSGRASGCHTNLRWHAETEENFSHYNIERSGDGRLFSTIETIKGTGITNTGIWYTYTDKTAIQFNFYRLKIVDLDGSFEYSKIINVNTDCTSDYKIELYPNPTSNDIGVVNLKFFTEANEVQIQIVDMQGKAVKQLNIGAVRDEVNSLRLDITDLPSGAYHLNILVEGGKTSTKTFIITNE